MVFSSLTFLFAYLPIVLIVYFMVGRDWRNIVLFIVSLFFYGWGEPVYVFLMIFSIAFNWLFGRAISFYRDKDRIIAKRLLFACMALNLTLLCFFKYGDFIIGNLNSLGLSFIKPLGLELPIGISFYTFQAMSYPIDLYRHDTDPQKSLINFGAYVSMFPQLIAGPIIRYRDIAAKLNDRHENIDQFAEGVSRFTCGLAKKVLLANSAGQVYETITALSASQMSVATAWLGALCYTFQIYFDFSGYSDMAIGLGKMLGFDFLENFNYPYISRSVTEFWRRWHMSLSFWFRDYVYIPLGGNRRGLKRQLVNLMIVWLLTGFWHGAAWNFVLWGVLYGVLLIIEKLFLLKYLEKIPAFLGRIYTMIAVIFLWMLFSHTDISEAGSYIAMMLGSTGSLADGITLYFLVDNLALILVCCLACTPVPARLFNRLTLNHPRTVWLKPVLLAGGLVICTAFIVDASYNPFLYFRF